MTTAFVAGATGYTGREVVRALRERGATTVAHVRPDSSSLAAWQSRFTALGATVDTTAWDQRAMTETLRAAAPTHVFALLGTTRRRARAATEGAGRDEGYEAVDYGLTALLLRATVASGHRPLFVYLSSLGATESTRSEYLRVRGRVERELRESGLPHLIVRPSFITGPDRDESRPAERFAAIATDAISGLAGAFGATALRDRYRSMTGRELGEAMVRLAVDRRHGGLVTGLELRQASRAPTRR